MFTKSAIDMYVAQWGFGLMKYPDRKAIHLDLQTRIHNSLVLVIRLFWVNSL